MNNFNQMVGNTNMYSKNQSSSYFNPAYGATTPTNNIIWVQGIEGAKAWQLNPNSMAILLDSEVEGKMYIKVSDNIGMSSLRIFNYVEEQPSSTDVTINKDLDLSDYVRKDEIAMIVKEIIENNEQPVPIVAESETSNGASATKIKSVKLLTK